MSHLDIRDPGLPRIVEDKPVVKRASGFRFTEGPVWRAQDGVLIFSDIPGDRLYSFEPGSDRVDIFRAPSNKTNGNCLDREGRLVSCEHATSRVVRQEPDGCMTTLASHYAGIELNSPNDVVVDSSGCLYFTDPPYGRYAGEGVLLGVGIPREEQQPVRGVYRVDPRTARSSELSRTSKSRTACVSLRRERFSSLTTQRRSTSAGSRSGKRVYRGAKSGLSSMATSLGCRMV